MATFEEIIIKVKVDEDGKKAKDLEKEIEKLEATLKDTTKSAEQHAEALKKLGRAQQAATQRGGEYTRVAERANRAQRELGQQTQAATGRVNRLGSSFGSLTGLVKGFIALEAAKYFVQFGAAVSNAGANLETTLVSFSTFLGSTEKAIVVTNQLIDASNRTAFTSDQYVSAGKQLLAYGVAAKDLIPILNSVGAVSAGLGKSQQAAATKFGETIEILGKIKVQQKVQGDDFNQFIERGINLVPSLSKQLGIMENQIKKAVEQGKVGYPQVEQAFRDMTSAGGQFFGLLEKQSQTQQGLISTLTGEWQSFLAVLAKTSGIGKEIKFVLRIVTDAVRDLKGQLSPSTQNLNDFNKALSQLDDEQLGFNVDRLTNSIKDQSKELNALEDSYNGAIKTAEKLFQTGKASDFLEAKKMQEKNIQTAKDIERQKDQIRFTKERVSIIELEATSRAKAAKDAEAAEFTRLRNIEKATLQSNLKIIAIQARTSEAIAENESNEVAERIEALKKLEAQRIRLANTQRRLAAFDLTSSEVDSIKKRTINFVANAEILKAQADRQQKESIIRGKGLEDAAKQLDDFRKKVEITPDIELLPSELSKETKDNLVKAYREILGDAAKELGDDEILKLGFAFDLVPTNEDGDELVSKYKDFFQAILPDLKELAINIADSFFDAQINSLDSAISIQEKRIDNARALAEKGNTSALEQETRRFEDLQNKRERAANRQLALNRNLTRSEIALAIARTASESGILSPATIPLTAFAIGAGFFGISSLLQNIPAYEGGGFTDSPKAFASGDLKGGNLALVNEGGKKEYIAPNWQVTNPQTAPFIEALELNRQGKPFMPPILNSTLNQSNSVDMAGVEQKLDTLIAVLPSIKSDIRITEDGIYKTTQKVGQANERANSKR
jgi:tape measure domain-containing protein